MLMKTIAILQMPGISYWTQIIVFFEKANSGSPKQTSTTLHEHPNAVGGSNGVLLRQNDCAHFNRYVNIVI